MPIRVGCCCGATDDAVPVFSEVGAVDGVGSGDAVYCAADGTVVAVFSLCVTSGG